MKALQVDNTFFNVETQNREMNLINLFKILKEIFLKEKSLQLKLSEADKTDRVS